MTAQVTDDWGTVVSGTAITTFAELSVDKVGKGYRLGAATPDTFRVTSNKFDINR